MVADDRSFDMLYESLVRLEEKVDDLSRKMSERDGERRFGAWILCSASALAGSGLAFALQFFAKRAL